jgi:transposase
MGRGRTFSREFKFAIVREVMRGDDGPAQICRKHGLNERMVLRWRKEVAARGEDAFTPQLAPAGDANELRIAELERLVGQLALENSVLKKGLQHVQWRSDMP